MHSVTILGAGLVGSVIARDLAADEELRVTVVDIDPATLSALAARHGASLTTIRGDLRDPVQVRNVVRDADVVVGAVPGSIGYRVVEQLADLGTRFVDISFMAEDPRALQDRALRSGCVGLVDFGVAPGLSNVLATRVTASLDSVEELTVYVGGLPQVRRLPFEYAAVFSPEDVLEVYRRPARLRAGGELVTRPALSDLELIDFPGLGTLEAFNTDGLRSLLWNLRGVPFMREKTLRYPGHAHKVQMLRDLGFFSRRRVRIEGADVRPADLSLALLERAWQLQDGEGDITVMRVQAIGHRDGHPQREAYDLIDRYDPESNTTSMARTTAFPCAIAVRMLLDGSLQLPPGIHFPERIAEDQQAMDILFGDLSLRGVAFARSSSELSESAPSLPPGPLPVVR